MANPLAQLRAGGSSSNPLAAYRSSVGTERISAVKEYLTSLDEQRKKRERLQAAIDEARRLSEQAERAQTLRARAGEYVFGGGLKETGKDVVRGLARTGLTLLDLANQRGVAQISSKGQPTGVGSVEIFGEKVESPISALERKSNEGTLTGTELAAYLGDAGLEVATTFVAPARMFKFLKGSGVLKNVARGTVEGAAVGAGFGLTGGLQDGQRGKDLAKTTGVGAAVGAGIGALPGVTRATFRGASKAATEIVNRTALKKIVNSIEKDLGKLDIKEITMVNEGIKNGATKSEIITGLRTVKGEIDDVKPVVNVKEQVPSLRNQLERTDYEAILKKKIEEAPEPKTGEVTVIQTGTGRYVDTQIDEALSRGVNKETRVFNVPEESIKLTDNTEKNLRGERLLIEETKRLEQTAAKQAAEGTGKEIKVAEKGKKKSRVGESIEDKAIQKELTQTFEGTAEYTPTTIKEQAKKSSAIVSDRSRTMSIINGTEKLPSDVRVGSFIVAAEKKALKEGDVELLRSLSKSRLVSETSVFAQELRTLAERSPNSATSKMAEVSKARKEKFSKGEVSKTKKQIKEKIKKAAPSRADWNKFITDITC